MVAEVGEEEEEEVSIEMVMPRATVQLAVRVTSGADQEPLKGATLTLRCRNPPSATVGDQQQSDEGSYVFASAVPVIDDDCDLEVEKDFFVAQTLPIKADRDGVQVNVHLTPAPISVIVHPVVGPSKEPLDDVQVALVCVNNGTGARLREEADPVQNKGDPYILKSAAPLDDNLVCKLEVSGEGLFTHTEDMAATLGVERVPVTVQVNQAHRLNFCSTQGVSKV